MTSFYQMTTRVANQICQLASHATKRVWDELKKDKSKFKGSLWAIACAIHACGLAVILILAATFFVLSALAVPFSAPSAGLVYLVMASMTIPLTLFLSVVVYTTFKQTRHHFSTSSFVQLTGECT